MLTKDLYELIADINPEEISDHIKRESLSSWSNSWRIAAKEIVNVISKAEAEKRLFIIPEPMTTDDIEMIRDVGRILNNLEDMKKISEKHKTA